MIIRSNVDRYLQFLRFTYLTISLGNTVDRDVYNMEIKNL